jgi:hypothetical protein
MKLPNFIYILLIIIFSGCEHKPIVREYREITRSSANASSSFEEIHSFLKSPKKQNDMSINDAKTQTMLEASKSNLPLIWKTPKGWMESQGSGMRLATFKSPDSDSIECSIVSLGGAAGGLEANIIRWLGQLGIPEPNANELKEFIASQEKIRSSQGLEMVLVDFTKWPSQQISPQGSMMATVFNAQESTIFIKMTGSIKAVTNNRSAFKSLCQSIRINNE